MLERFKMLRRVVSLVAVGLLYHSLVVADEVIRMDESVIKLVEEDSADCAIAEGKLISIQNTDPKKGYQVWVDRWFMNVQTPDHTKQILLPNAAPTPLGCSMARGGGKQHWTIHSVTSLQAISSRLSD